MGGQLVKRAHAAAFYELQRGRPFTSNAMLVLLYMSSIAMDTDTPPRFWQGRDVLAEHALSRLVPADAAGKRSVYESIRRAIKELEDRGALRRGGGGYPGRAKEYELTVENLFPASLRGNATLGHSQPDVGPLATPRWEMTQPHKGPETKRNQDQEETTDHLERGPHLRAVDNRKGETDVA